MSIPYTSSYEGTLGFTGIAPNMSLAMNTELTYTVPGESKQKYVATFGYKDNQMVYVAVNATATIPTAGTLDTASVAEPKPYQRFVKGGDVLSFITPDATADCGFSLRTITG